MDTAPRHGVLWCHLHLNDVACIGSGSAVMGQQRKQQGAWHTALWHAGVQHVAAHAYLLGSVREEIQGEL